MAPRFYLQKDIIELFGCSERWFRNHRADLEHGGFPKPVQFGEGLRPRYLREDVDAYFERIGKQKGSASRAMLDRKHQDQEQD